MDQSEQAPEAEETLTPAMGSYSAGGHDVEFEEPEPTDLFDIAHGEIPSFGALMQARPSVFSSQKTHDTFLRHVENLASSGEEGRRRGLGMWMLGRYAEAAEALSSHGDDDVAAYTAARSLVSLQRLDEAAAIFRKLSEKYPTEPRPRGDMLDAELDLALTKGDVEAAVSSLEAALAGLPEAFGGAHR